MDVPFGQRSVSLAAPGTGGGSDGVRPVAVWCQQSAHYREWLKAKTRIREWYESLVLVTAKRALI
jgi:hypothetical protein